MNLYLLRHGIAVGEESWNQPDELRPLTGEGKKKMAGIAAFMFRAQIVFDVIITSPAARAKETADIVRSRYSKIPVDVRSELSPGTLPNSVLSCIAEHDAAKALLVIGHEPDLSILASFLVFGQQRSGIRLRKGGLCCLEIEHLHCGPCAFLRWLLTPKLMLTMQQK